MILEYQSRFQKPFFIFLFFFFFFLVFGIEESQRTTRRKRIKGTQKEFRLSIQNQSQLKLKLNHSTTNMNFLVLLTLNFALTTGAIPAPNPNPNAISSRSSVAAGAMNLVSRAETIFEKRGSSCGQMCFEQGDCIGHCSYCDIDKDSICSMFIKCLSKKKKKKKIWMDRFANVNFFFFFFTCRTEKFQV